MVTVTFYDKTEDANLKYAVIVSKSDDKWVFCKHKGRTTLECPGGHREEGEDIRAAAERELYEETGAVEYSLTRVAAYSVQSEEEPEKSFGMLFFARIRKFDALPEFEMERIELLKELPDNWTYPEIQPKLLDKVRSWEILNSAMFQSLDF